jgi:hypothetical protein
MDRMNWRTSSYSTGNGECVEVSADVAVLVRDTVQNSTGPVLSVSPVAWTRFVRSL